MNVMEGLKKEKSLKGFCIFMVIMAVLSLVSRGIYGTLLARVEFGYVTMSPITHKITGSGMVAGGEAHPVFIKEGILVEKVHFSKGTKVNLGDTIVTLNAADLEEKMKEAEKKLQVEETLLRDMQFNKEQADAEAVTAKERAGADFNQVTEEQNELLTKAKEEYEKTLQSLEEFPSFEAYFQALKETDEKYLKLYEESKDENKTKAERKGIKKELKDYEKELEASAKESYKKEKQDLEAISEGAKEVFEAAENNSEKEIEGARRNYLDAGKQTKDEASLLLQKNAVEAAEKEVEELQTLIDQGGKIISEYEGVVSDFYVKAGESTGGGTAFIIVDGGDGWQFFSKISEEERKYIRAGDSIQLNFPNLGMNHIKAEILSVSIQTDETGMYEFTADLGEGEYSYGEIGEYSFTKQNVKSDENSCYVPLTALHEEIDGTYVLVISEESTFLGTELRAVKRMVEVSDKNDTYAQLKDSPLGADEKIIISSDKPVLPDDIVREKEPL